MAPCSNPVLTRIEKIAKNQIVNPGSSPYNQMPEEGGAPQNNNASRTIIAPQGNSSAPVLPSESMQSVTSGSTNENAEGNVAIETPGTGITPELIPNSPTFTVPANPLLPEGYQEVLDYNAVQYVNGFYRTQIGRYVRVTQLMGSNTLESQEGFLIGVGVNYILLQESLTGNVLVIDIYGIKNMYVYYTYRENPFMPLNMGSAASGGMEHAVGLQNADNPMAQKAANEVGADHRDPA